MGKGQKIMEQVSLFERVPADKRLSIPDVSAILSGVVSSLSKLMGGGIMAFYAGCRFGVIAMIITFVLSFGLTWLVGKISYREGLPNNVTSRFYIFGTKGSAIGSLIWIFLLTGVLAIGTVQLGNAVMYYFGWTTTFARWTMFFCISALWVVISLFGVKFISRFNALFVCLLFCMLGYIFFEVASAGNLVDALTHDIMIPGESPRSGFAYTVNYAVETSGLLALFAADFTRFAKKERDVCPISLIGTFFALCTYVLGAVIAYYGFDRSVEYFLSRGYDAAGAAGAAVTNPGVTIVLSAGLLGLLIILCSQAKVETSNSIGSSNAVSNFFDSLFGIKLKWWIAVLIANGVGLIFILANILDKISSFMGYGSILTMSWCFLLITDYYIVRGPMKIGTRGINSLAHVENWNWRGIGTILIVTVVNVVLFATGTVAVPLVVVAPMTVVLYILLSVIFKDKVRERDARLRELDAQDLAAGAVEDAAETKDAAAQ